MNYIPSGSQTVGPFFNFGLTTNAKLGIVAGPECAGERVRLTIQVTDGASAPTAGDAMIELWQADAAGVYGSFPGFGRLETSSDGSCTFETIRPGRVIGPEGSLQAPHINVIVFARGLLKHLHTRVYFEGDPSNAEDTVLNLVPLERLPTLMARPVEGKPGAWHFPIVLQGEGETVFFDV